MQKKIILFELNEVPFRVLEAYCKWKPNSNLSAIYPSCTKKITLTADLGHLSPWITWPSLHRGVNNLKHGIKDFGQDLEDIDKKYPPIWHLLNQHGLNVGVCGSLHTYPLPKNVSSYAFFLPDTFAKGEGTYPPKLRAFQEFNLVMARASARNVSTKIPLGVAAKLLAKSSQLGLRIGTFLDIAKQLLSERMRPERKVRRRTYQSVLAFDIFLKCLDETRPDFATVFSNHVASAMHRFWPATFPEDYQVMGYDQNWLDTYSSEIRFAMDRTDDFLGKLIAFANENDEYVVWIASSMGQAATSAVEIKTQLYVTDASKFMSAFNLLPHQWSQMPAMLPEFNVKVSKDASSNFRNLLENLNIAGKNVGFRETNEELFSIDFGHPNLDLENTSISLMGKTLNPQALGLKNVEIEDRTGSSAYHIPEGCLLVYDPRDKSKKDLGEPISALDLVPMMLSNFNIPVPPYMKQPIETNHQY